MEEPIWVLGSLFVGLMIPHRMQEFFALVVEPNLSSWILLGQPKKKKKKQNLFFISNGIKKTIFLEKSGVLESSFPWNPTSCIENSWTRIVVDLVDRGSWALKNPAQEPLLKMLLWSISKQYLIFFFLSGFSQGAPTPFGCVN